MSPIELVAGALPTAVWQQLAAIRVYTVDGGQESTAVDKEAPTAERTGKFALATGAYEDRMLFGWVDVEKLYNDAQQTKQP